MRVAIIGGRWPDVDIEADVLGVNNGEIVRDPGATRDDILATAADADVILAGPRPAFDAETIDGLNGRGIVRYGVGYDNVDIAAARDKGMEVAYVPDYGTEAVALHAVSLALTLLRKITQADRLMHAGRWDLASLRPLHLPSALTAGIVGFGRIGRRTAELLTGVGFGRVLAFDDRIAIDARGVEGVALGTLLAQSDLVSVHASASAEGTPVVGRSEIALFKEGSVLVNTARGRLVDQGALIDGLRAGRPAAAALDVFDPEPPDPAVFGDVAEHIIMTPHMAWYTEETERELRTKTAEEAKRILDGRPVRYPVPGEVP